MNTVSYIGLALDAAVMRQQIIANNLANVHTEGYRAQRLKFELRLGDSSTQSVSLDAEGVEVSPTLGSASVRIDQEVAAMTQNSTHYQALLRLLNKQISMLQMAASEGKK